MGAVTCWAVWGRDAEGGVKARHVAIMPAMADACVFHYKVMVTVRYRQLGGGGAGRLKPVWFTRNDF